MVLKKEISKFHLRLENNLNLLKIKIGDYLKNYILLLIG